MVVSTKFIVDVQSAQDVGYRAPRRTERSCTICKNTRGSPETKARMPKHRLTAVQSVMKWLSAMNARRTTHISERCRRVSSRNDLHCSSPSRIGRGTPVGAWVCRVRNMNAPRRPELQDDTPNYRLTAVQSVVKWYKAMWLWTIICISERFWPFSKRTCTLFC
ncbi:hypothetical protein OH77DRAFT_580296 [Trametes cingulata]|nr:hypothetical protein OH77DRAFT_580296 [Trametes cingulata]